MNETTMTEVTCYIQKSELLHEQPVDLLILVAL